MNAPFDPALLTSDKFAIGQPVSRKEDPVLLRGEGRYTDDLNRPDQLHAVMVRSRMAHGDIRGIDLDAARATPGVHAVITGRRTRRRRHSRHAGGSGKASRWHADAAAAATPSRR